MRREPECAEYQDMRHAPSRSIGPAADPNGDRRRRRRPPGPGNRRHPLLRPRAGRRERQCLQLGAGTVHTPHRAEPAPGSVPLQGDAILGNQSTLRLRCDSWTKAEADARFLRTNDLGPLDARYFPNTPGAEGSGIFNLVQTQFTRVVIRNMLCQTPLSCQPILGNGSTPAPPCKSAATAGARAIGWKVPADCQLQLPIGHRPGERPWGGANSGPDR